MSFESEGKPAEKGALKAAEAAQFADIRKRLEEHKGSRTWAALAAETGIAEGTLAPFIKGTYMGVYANVSDQAEKFFETLAAKKEARGGIAVPAFLATDVYGQVRRQLLWAHTGQMTTFTGDAGIGKTKACQNYAEVNANVWMFTGSPSLSSVIAVLQDLVDIMGLPLKAGLGSAHLTRQIRNHVRGKGGLIIVDEAGELTEGAVEELRAIHDATKVGICFVGNRDVMRGVKGKRPGPQLTSRNASRALVGKPPQGDVDMLLDAWGVVDAKERAYLSKIALFPGGGALRALTNTLLWASLVAEQADQARSIVHFRAAAKHHEYKAGEV